MKQIILFFLISTVLISCSGIQNKVETNSPIIDTWYFTSLDGEQVDLVEPIYIQFLEDNTIAGYAGCNRIMGEYTVDYGTQINIRNLATTKMACPDLELESTVLDVLEQANNFTVANGVLNLNIGKRAPLAILTNQKPVMQSSIYNKKWKLDVMDGTSVSSNSVYLRFNSDNSITGNAGCNRVMGEYTIENGTQITINNLATTKMACPDLELESKVLDVLEQTNNFTISNGKLNLTIGKRAPLATFSEVRYTQDIVNKYWKLIKLDGKSVEMADNQEKEQYFMLHSDGTVSGFTGCNTISGEYELNGDKKIRFADNMATTLKLCPDVDVDETAFISVFAQADNYTVDHDTLYLNIGNQAPIAVFEAVYFE